ncbi:MAG: hypothetical protein ACYS22_09910 [Planctomycetota bacterium]
MTRMRSETAATSVIPDPAPDADSNHASGEEAAQPSRREAASTHAHFDINMR